MKEKSSNFWKKYTILLHQQDLINKYYKVWSSKKKTDKFNYMKYKNVLYQNTPLTKIEEKKKRLGPVIYHIYNLYKEFLEWARKTKQVI